MRLELTRVGLLAELANYYTTRGAYNRFTKCANVGEVIKKMIDFFNVEKI